MRSFCQDKTLKPCDSRRRFVAVMDYEQNEDFIDEVLVKKIFLI